MIDEELHSATLQLSRSDAALSVAMETLIMSVRDPLTYTMGGCVTLNSSDLQSDIELERERQVRTTW